MLEPYGVSERLDADGILRLVFEMPETKVNLLSQGLLQALGELLDAVKNRDEVRAVMFASSKPGMFIAGMDMEQIAQVSDAYKAAEAARFGQSVFQRIADLGKPTLAAIGGACVGGGTELALACDFRIAGRGRRTRIGLPEVKIGIIPGFGGCQRLPRLVGMMAALDVIMTGKQLDARRARKIGLVDMVVPDEYLEREGLKLLQQAINDGVSRVQGRYRKRRPMVERAVEGITPLRNYVLDQARKKTKARVEPRNYPAPFRAVEAIEAAITEPLPKGLDLEARIVGELVPTPTSKNLIWLFKSQTAIKGDLEGVRAVPQRVHRAAVVGAGIMGGGIAQLIADREIPVRLKDLRYDAILTALQTASGVWKKQLKRRRITPREMSQRMAFIAPTTDDTGLRHVDLVVEAVAENLDIKRQVLAAVEEQLNQRAVFATNTSSIPISEIATSARRPERVVGLHFFNPVHRMPLVEVIAGTFSSPEAIATAHAFARRLGKVPVLVKDGPGFLVNRILTLYLFEALRMLREGVRIEAADKAMTAFGMPMGPFALMDQVGLDTSQHVGEVLREAFGRRLGEDDGLLAGMVASGRLGQKNGKGFYRYRAGKRTVPDREVYDLAGSPTVMELPPETLQERMVLAMVNESALCMQEGVAREPRDLDVAMVMGTGFPPFRGGLLRHADAVGIPIVADRLSRLADAHGERFRPAASLQEMVRGQTRFYSDS